MWLLLLLFAFRVVAQPLALVVDSALLPPFESWHSAALPYGLLLADRGFEGAVAAKPELAGGLNVAGGKITHPAVAAALHVASAA